MTERPITHLRHVALAVPDLAAQRHFYTGPWGLTEVATDGGLSYLAAEGSTEHHVVRVRADDDKRIDLIGFGVTDADAVDALAERLGTAGVRLLDEPADLDGPDGGYGFRCFDRDGRTVELATGSRIREAREIEVGEALPVALSHVVVNSSEPEATVAWYVDHLGFELSDTLFAPHLGEMMWFLRCNASHHSLAVARCPHHSLHHLSFALRGVDENMRATGRVLRAGSERIWGPGRHLAGDNMFNYFLDPNGNTMEYTTELELVGRDWEPRVHDFTRPEVADQWGTANPMGPELAARSFNDPDRGLFVAPPV